jgi:4'-phosphopantetheinyl transferase
MLDPTEVRLGCDLELVEERSAAFIADYLTEREQAFVAAADSEEARWVRSNLVWSAKESVLKVLRTGLRRDTRSVEVQVSSGSGHHGWCELHARTLEGRVFAGWWRRFGAFLLTVACEEPAAPPRALVDPPGLQRATPSHSWLQAPDALRVPIDTGKLARGGAKK